MEPLSSATYFQFKLDAVKSGSYSSKAGWQAISDSGTAFIGAPQAASDGIAKAFGATWDPDNQVYNVDCKAQASVTVTIGGKDYTTNASNMIVSWEKGCLLALAPFDEPWIGWILGDPFIRQYCNIYDLARQRIGFAPSKQM
ncbi:unnamed protein product, partial [Mesorhabditis belari]|uniref:Peptidase A1 domain-containing protein n=1 Tax=Mesorhabditis belari TaxID=2138241 RepID=A0AAF3FDR7_9BILA